MNITPNWRDKRNIMPPLYFPYASYSTDTKNMKTTFAEDMFLNNFHLGLDPLRKNLADMIVTQEKMAPKNSKSKLEKQEMKVEEETHMPEDVSPLTGISNFISGVLNVISNAMFSKRKPADFSSNSGHNMALPSMWHDAKLTDENKNLQAEYSSDDMSSEFLVPEMSDCRSAAAHCQSKLDQVRSLLGADKPTPCSLRFRRRPKKVFVEPNHVEDHFEDAFSPEDFENLANDSYIKYFSPVCHHNHTYDEVDSATVKVETYKAPEMPVNISKSSEVLVSPKMLSDTHSDGIEIPKLDSENTKNDNETAKTLVPELITPSNNLEVENKKKVVDSCEDKMTKLKLLLQERCKKSKTVKPVEIEPVTTLPPLNLEPEPTPLVSLPPRPKPSTTVKDKKFKNPNRCCHKRRKARMRKGIEDDALFANEVSSEELSSSIESSPSTSDMEKYMGSLAKPDGDADSNPTVPTKDFFNEVVGCFQSSSVDSNESFQIVFHDTPRSRRSSECDSEDSFIIFEDSPDSCYTSNDVFGESDEATDSEGYDSDSDVSDSGCGVFKLSGSLSKSVCNLADDSLYVDHSEDEVDCANLEDLTICDSVRISECDDTGASNGLLLDDRKKMLKKKLPAKRVRFSPNPPKVHVMRVWLYAAKQTRVRYWQQFAVDRERFQRRIADVDMAVSWVLKPQHRSRVMFQRFMPWWNAQKRKEIAEKKEKEAQEKLEQEERLRNQEIESLYAELDKDKTDSDLNEGDTNTDISKPKEGKTDSGDKDLDDNDSYKTLINTVDIRELDASDSLGTHAVSEEKRNDNNSLVIEEIECHNSTNIQNGSIENSNNTNKMVNEKSYSKEIVPFKDNKLNTDYVNFHPEYIKLNT